MFIAPIRVNIEEISLVSKPLKISIIYNKYSIFLPNSILDLEGSKDLLKKSLEFNI
jgi:hypothetical protein